MVTKEPEVKHEAKHEHEAEAEAKRLEEAAKKRDEAARKFNEEGLKRDEARLKEVSKDKDKDEPKFQLAERSEGSLKDAISLLGTIQASATNADGATTTSAASAFLGGGEVVTAMVTNGATPPTQACQIILLLSADGTTYYRVDSKWAGFAPSGVYFATFNMADYARQPQNFGLTSPWLWYKIRFSGNIGAAVTVAATNSGT